MGCCNTVISKHLMLLFIELQFKTELRDTNFKTSHVIVYQAYWYLDKRKELYFKTSHVIVYRIRLKNWHVF